MSQLTEYNGYLLKIGAAPVEVFDMRSKFADAPIYRASSIDKAMRWIDAYREGRQWAVAARLRA